MFQSFLNNHCLKDVTFQGSIFSWNKGFIFEQLNRALYNYQWDSLAPNTIMLHLHKIKSDHRPIAVSFCKGKKPKLPRSFQFLSSWLTHESFIQFVTDN